MKKNILCSLLIFGCLALYTEFAVATIVGSQHDLTASGVGNFVGDNNEVCVYCHTPHGGYSHDNAARGAGYANNLFPLWNRTDYTTTNLNQFTMYTSATFTANYYGDGKPTGYSLMCLSCHDGVSSIGWVKNNSYSGGGPTPPTITMNYDTIANFQANFAYSPHKNINIGRDLSNDHPISIIYSVADGLLTRDPGLNDPSTVVLNTPLRLYGPSKNLLECPTCHDPHEYGSTVNKAPFLRMSNDNSDMCRACHNK